MNSKILLFIASDRILKKSLIYPSNIRIRRYYNFTHLSKINKNGHGGFP